MSVMTVYPPEMVEDLSRRGIAFVLFEIPDVMSGWVVDGKLVPRPVCPIDIVEDDRRIVLSNVPDGTQISISIAGQVIVTDETAFEFDEPGPVHLKVTPPWPYQELTYDIEIE